MCIFLASPGDVRDERDRLSRVVEQFNRGTVDRFGLTVELLRWETHTTPDVGRPQQVIFDQLPASAWDIFVGILWLRFGTESGETDPETGQAYRSGTEEEFQAAYRRRIATSTGWPKVMFYRCTRPPTNLLAFDMDQYARVDTFFKDFAVGSAHPGLVQHYQQPEEFERLVREHLERWL